MIYPNYIYNFSIPIFKPDNLKPDKPNEKICRICYENDSKLIYPCKCSGSIKWIHESCLKKWIETSNKNICPQCKYEYKKQTKFKYPKLKFLVKNISVKIVTCLLIVISICILSIISFKIKKDSSLDLFSNIQMFTNIYHIYNGLKIFLIISVIILTTLHIKKKIDILEIISQNNLNIGANILEFSLCIFIIFNQLVKNIITKYMNEKTVYLNYISDL